jgi:hypothetical protein
VPISAMRKQATTLASSRCSINDVAVPATRDRLGE